MPRDTTRRAGVPANKHGDAGVDTGWGRADADVLTDDAGVRTHGGRRDSGGVGSLTGATCASGAWVADTTSAGGAGSGSRQAPPGTRRH